jgi:molecular chaperone Hsp33
MSDRIVRGLYPELGLTVLFVRAGDTARMVRVLHGLGPPAAWLFAEGLCAAALLGALQKDARGRVNLQLEGDGPLHGLLVDADTEGNLRGYVRAPGAESAGEGAQAARAAMGASGYLSVIRDHGGGNFYRSAVALGGDHLADVLRRWFAVSEQVETALDLAVVPRGAEPLGEVAGILIQRLPDGDAAAVEAAREKLRAGALSAALRAGAGAQAAIEAVVGPGFELLADQEVAYRCGCSLERARVAVSALGPDGVAEVLAAEGKAEVTREFCHAHYLLDRAALEDIERRLRAGEPGPELA